MFYIVAIKINVPLIDITILKISDELGNLVANVFRMFSQCILPSHRETKTHEAETTTVYLLKINVKVIALYFEVLCLNFNYFTGLILNFAPQAC